MKTIPSLIFGVAATIITSGANAATFWAFSGTITSVNQAGPPIDPAALANLRNHYAASGIAAGQAVNFQGIIDFSRQGQYTDIGGNTHTLADYGPTSQCQWSSAEPGCGWAQWRYAELQSSNIDLSQSIYQSSYNGLPTLDVNVANSGYERSNNHTYYSGFLELANLTISRDYPYNQSLWVSNWSLGEGYSFYLSFNDGAGPILVYGNLSLTTFESIAVPLPGAALFFASSLLGLSSIRKLKNSEASV